jgi:Protein of unknown function (DUF1566)
MIAIAFIDVRHREPSDSILIKGKEMLIKLLLGFGLLGLGSYCVATPYVVSTNPAEIIDNRTGLTWKRCTEGTTWTGASCEGMPLRFTFEMAQARAKSEALASGVDWRVPSEAELMSITKSGLSPSVDWVAFPNTPPNKFWTCTPLGLLVSCGVEPVPGPYSKGKFVLFATGAADVGYRAEANYVRLVRGGSAGNAHHY